MRVLVVGASGYLGQAISRSLESGGHEVVGLGRRGLADIAGDVNLPRLGLDDEAVAAIGDIEAVVASFGSVDMGGDPPALVGLHVNGTSKVLDFAASIPTVRRVVHISSILALGRATGLITNRDLSRGQTFRNWYEYAKYRGELIARRETRVPVSIVRLGTLLGPAPARVIPRGGGPLSVLPHLVSGLPVALENGGEYPVYAADVAVAATVVRDVLTAETPPAHCTYFDPDVPTLAAVLTSLCAPWHVVPKIVDAVGPSWLNRTIARRFRVEPDVTEYARPLFRFDPSIFDSLPTADITSPTDYIFETGLALRDAAARLTATGGVR